MTGKHKKEWFDDETFWREFYPLMFTEERFAKAAEEIQKVLDLTKPNGKSALDLCCGPGRCSLALTRAGFKVTGVDKTKYLLNKARAKARAAKVKIEWVQSDMRDFVRAETFDLALSMFTSFGYFNDKNEDEEVLANILASLKPGGVFLIDVIGKEIIAKNFQGNTCDIMPDGTRLVQHHKIFDNWTRIRNEWLLIRKGRVQSFKFHHTVYSGLELMDLMQRAGFAQITLYGNLDGDVYDHNAERLIAVGRKSE